MEPSHFMTHSLQRIPWGRHVASVLAAALQAVEPAAAVSRFMQRTGNRLGVEGRDYALDNYRRVLIVGAGKAGAPMALAASQILGDRFTQGIVIVKEGYLEPHQGFELPQGLTLLEAGHPLPDERGLQGTHRILQLLEGAQPGDLVICLISGGGSALLPAPVDGVNLEDLQALTSVLLESGATINEINALRKHLDQLKGGKLARLASPAQLVTLILSDVVGNPLDVIASGPTVADRSTFEEAYQVLERYAIRDKVPASVVGHLQRGCRGEVPENPQVGDPLFANVQNVIIGSNAQAAQAAVEKARQDGFNGLLLTTYLQGEARQAGRMLASLGRQIEASGQPAPRPACLVVGGETTVTLQGNGWGGRNQEMALGAVQDLAGLPNLALVTLASDGGDGPTDAAGAVVCGETLARAQAMGLDPEHYLANNDSYHFFEPLGDLLKPGPTQTNVNDLAFLFAF